MKISGSQQKCIREFNALVEQGELSFQEDPCLCGVECSEQIASRDRYGFWHPVGVCRGCGLVRHNPRMTDEAYRFFYSSDIYRQVYGGENYLDEAERRMSSDYGQHVYDDVSSALNPQTLETVLEFGCAGGWNLLPFARAGLRVRGYDYGPSLVELGRKFDLDLRVGSLNDIEGMYDLIILNHVAEHFTDFYGSMKALIGHLNPGGWLYVGVPNIDNYGQEQLQNAHVFYFSPRTFQHYMSRCGLSMFKFGPAQAIHMYGVFQTDPGMDWQVGLDSEYVTIMPIIRKVKVRQKIGNVLQGMGLKEPVKKLWEKLSI
jgi:SAM-dependent methyltransferase